MTDPVARVLALAAYARAVGCCPPCSLTYGRGLVEGALQPELLDAGEPFAVAAIREVERAGVRCASAGHPGARR